MESKFVVYKEVKPSVLWIWLSTLHDALDISVMFGLWFNLDFDFMLADIEAGLKIWPSICLGVSKVNSCSWETWGSFVLTKVGEWTNSLVLGPVLSDFSFFFPINQFLAALGLTAVSRLSLVTVSWAGLLSSLQCVAFSLRWLLLLQSTGSTVQGLP